jgi:hypothetical protein
MSFITLRKLLFFAFPWYHLFLYDVIIPSSSDPDDSLPPLKDDS